MDYVLCVYGTIERKMKPQLVLGGNPMAVLESERKKGVGRALLLKSLESMQELGYAYAIIG